MIVDVCQGTILEIYDLNGGYMITVRNASGLFFNAYPSKVTADIMNLDEETKIYRIRFDSAYLELPKESFDKILPMLSK